MKTFDRYKVNLREHNNKIYSYISREYNLPIIEMDEGKYVAGHLNIKA